MEKMFPITLLLQTHLKSALKLHNDLRNEWISAESAKNFLSSWMELLSPLWSQEE